MSLHQYLPHFELLSAMDTEQIAQSDFKCEECLGGGRAEAYCTECQMHMCSACHRHHMRSKATMRHSVTLLANVEQDSTRAQPVVHRAHYCAIHRHCRYEFFCVDCDTLICSECARGAHELHSYKLPSESLVEKHRRTMQVDVEALSQRLLEAETARQNLSQRFEKAELKAGRVQAAIGKSFDQFHTAIDARVAELSRSSMDDFQQRQQILEAEKAECSSALVEISRTIDFLENVTSRGTDVEILQVKGQLKQRHQRQFQQWCDIARKQAPMCCVPGDVAAGWRSPAEADRVLAAVGSFGAVDAQLDAQGVPGGHGLSPSRCPLTPLQAEAMDPGRAPEATADGKGSGEVTSRMHPQRLLRRHKWADMDFSDSADEMDFFG